MKIKTLLIILSIVLSTNLAIGQKDNKKIVVSGLVTDGHKNPIVGAIIKANGGMTTKATNNNGFYRIKLDPGADSLTVITFTNGIGISAINGRTTINFTFADVSSSEQNIENRKAGDELVNAGYGWYYDKDDLANSITSVNGSEKKFDSYGSIQDMLKGTPGVQVIPGPGLTGDRIIVQGQSSISHITEPLFVVDGVPRDNINNIMPNMVKNISVLKGSSSSIYGSRGAFGVILITLE